MELKKYRLGEICEIYGRIGFRGYTTMDLAENENDGAITLSPSNIENGEISFARNTYLKWNKFYESPEIILEKGDVVLVKTGSSIGKTALVRDIPHPITLNPQFVVLKKIKTDSIYLSYVLKGEFFQKSLHAITVGSTIPTLSQENLSNISIFLPSIENQRRIASVLSSLDRKIALNRRINAKLEQIAKRLYDYWFVQFNFPDKNGKPYKSNGGKMVWNEVLKREVPEGWEVGNVVDFIKPIERGISYSSKDIMNNNGCAMLNLACFSKQGEYRINEIKYFSGTINDSNKAYPFDMFIACTDMTQDADVIGRPILATKEYDYYTYSMDLAKITPDNINKMYLYYTLRTPFYHKYIKPFASGTTVKHLDVKGVENYKITIPKSDTQNIFENITRAIKGKQMLLINEQIALTRLRNKLLPLLMNGQVEVK